MGKRKKVSVAVERKEPSKWIPIGISVVALLVSGVSAWQSREARRFSYRVSLPAITAKFELAEPIQAGKDIIVRIKLENRGQTAAKGLHPELGWAIVKRGGTFAPAYPDVPGLAGSRSDLQPGAETTLTSTSSVSLEHEHDVELLKTDGATLHIYGRAQYRGLDDELHEVHFCGQYRVLDGLKDPLSLVYCDSYNETVAIEK
jgi:hypothetical protein